MTPPPTKEFRLTVYCVFLAMLVTFFWPLVFQAKVLAPLDILDELLRPWAQADTPMHLHNAFTYDAVSQYLPYDWSVYQSLRQDGYIGWNPNTHSGSSIVENTMISPGDWRHHLYRMFPFWHAWNLGIILQFMIAGVGMMLLLRNRGIPAVYALAGVVAFCFYSQFTLWIYHRWVLGAMCWSPWILWALFRARDRGRIIDPLATIFIGLAFRGGHLQSSLFVVLLVGIIAFCNAWPHLRSLKLWNALKAMAPHLVCGILGTLLAIDVFLETVPALLHGNKEMTERGWLSTLAGLPTLITSILPTVMGTPQGLDAMKFFESDLSSIKFMGAVVLLLAVMGLANKHAPFEAKTLLLIGILLPFTPADKWLYSRFTVVFALGGAWLAAWQLSRLASSSGHPWLRRAAVGLAVVALVWTIASAAITVQDDKVRSIVHHHVEKNLPANKSLRYDWMLSRASDFLDRARIWHPHNLAMIALVGAGLFAASRIRSDARRPHVWACVLASTTFGELFLFASTWITWSHRPSGDSLYDKPPWIESLHDEIGLGGIRMFDRSDFDYLQLNTPSVYGLRFAEGYDTVTPKRVDHRPAPDWDPEAFARSGISHVIANPLHHPFEIPGWDLALQTPEFVLFSNPAFQAIHLMTSETGEEMQADLIHYSPNRRIFVVPPNSKSLTILESHNPGWKYAFEDGSWQSTVRMENGAMHIPLNLADEEYTLLVQYRPALQAYYRPVVALVILMLSGVALNRLRLIGANSHIAARISA